MEVPIEERSQRFGEQVPVSGAIASTLAMELPRTDEFQINFEFLQDVRRLWREQGRPWPAFCSESRAGAQRVEDFLNSGTALQNFPLRRRDQLDGAPEGLAHWLLVTFEGIACRVGLEPDKESAPAIYRALFRELEENSRSLNIAPRAVVRATAFGGLLQDEALISCRNESLGIFLLCLSRHPENPAWYMQQMSRRAARCPKSLASASLEAVKLYRAESIYQRRASGQY